MRPQLGELVVVRGGTSQTLERVVSLLEDSIEDGDGAVLSVFAERVQPGDDLAQTIERICRSAGVPHTKILVTNERRLRAAGVDLVASVDDGEAMNHHHVVFDHGIDLDQIRGYVAAWDQAVPNPTGGKRAK